MTTFLKLLMVEDNPGDARLTRELLREADDLEIDLVHMDTLARGLACCDEHNFDAILLDLSLPDTSGIEAVIKVNEKSPGTPIIVLSGQVNDSVAISALQQGAQDYLIKGQGDGYLMGRTIRYAIQRKRIETQLIEAKEAAELADRAKTEFLANMSHELRTPLNAIIGFSSMMTMESWGPLGHDAYKEYAKDIHQSGSHLLGVINDILDLSKISVGKFEIAETDVCVGALIEDCMRMVRIKAEAAGLELIVEVPFDLPSLFADERMVKRILLNLLSNAVKFSTEGHVRVAARLGVDNRIELCVEDTGIGIPAEALPTLMQPFVQIDGSHARQYEGTGLGLSLVKSMVELHGGSVAMTSELGVGTTVTMHFPADRTLSAGETTPIARLSGDVPGERAPVFSGGLQLATAQ